MKKKIQKCSNFYSIGGYFRTERGKCVTAEECPSFGRDFPRPVPAAIVPIPAGGHFQPPILQDFQRPFPEAGGYRRPVLESLVPVQVSGRFERPIVEASEYQRPCPLAGDYRRPVPAAMVPVQPSGRYERPLLEAGDFQQPCPLADDFQGPILEADDFQRPVVEVGDYQRPIVESGGFQQLESVMRPIAIKPLPSRFMSNRIIHEIDLQ